MKPGDRIGFRTLVSPIEAVSGRKRWIVRCDCGRTGSAREDGLRRGIADRCLDCARKTQPRKPGRPYVVGDRIGVFELVDAGDPAQKLLFRRVVAACTACGAHHERTIHSLTAGAMVEAYGCSMGPRMESRRVVLDVLADGTPRRTTDIWRRSGMIRQQRHFQRVLDTLLSRNSTTNTRRDDGSTESPDWERLRLALLRLRSGEHDRAAGVGRRPPSRLGLPR